MALIGPVLSLLKSLEALDLSDNRLKSLPTGFKDLPLSAVDLGGNHLVLDLGLLAVRGKSTRQ